LDLYWDLLHPAYGPVRQRAFEVTDVVTETKAPFHMLCGRHSDRLVRTWEQATSSPEWRDVITEIQTPRGPLRSVYAKSTCNKPGYIREHMVRDGRDLDGLLSLPYEPYPYTSEAYLKDTQTLGDAGIVIQAVEHGMNWAHQLMGSETLAYVSVDCRDILHAVLERFAVRTREHIRQVLASGVRPVFGWVGPEVCIPPLMSLRDFEEFVFANDKPTLDLIHEAGCRAWVHCHNDMHPVLERFVDMGVDVLNPIEPPPTGRLTLREALARVGDRMGLEGNIEVHDVMTLSKRQFASKLEEAIAAGRGHRFILGLCSGYMEDPFPSDRLLENLMVFVEEGVRLAQACARD